MRVLITWGSERGGTEGIARILGQKLQRDGIDVTLLPAHEALGVAAFDAVIVGGALYANRWHRAARKFIHRNVDQLRKRPVWFFSSGPLDDSADERTIEPTRQVEILMERVGARGHVTFGGRLERHARGFPASAMAKKMAGDWRNPQRINAWAEELARALPHARPGPAVDQPGRSLAWLVGHAAAGWALCALAMVALMRVAHPGLALAINAVLVALVFAAVAASYFGARGSRDALPAAIGFTAVAAVLDVAVLGGLVHHSLALLSSIAGTWLPLAIIFLVTWGTGAARTMMPSDSGHHGATPHVSA